MTTNRSIAAALAATLLIGAFPGMARADDDQAGARHPAAATNLRASVDRAAARLATQPSVDTRNQRAASAAQGMPMGGGGGKGMMIVSLVTTVVGLAATYYFVKQAQEQSKQAGQQ